MASRTQAVTVRVYAYDTGASAPKTGDAANITLRVVKDNGSPAAPTNALAEVDATNLPGWYKVLLTAAECTCDTLLVGGKSSTSGVVITGTQITFEQLPTAAPAANGGLPTVDANNNVHGVQPGTGTGQLNPSGGVVPADVAKINGSSLAPDYLVAFVTGYNNGTINANLTGNVVGSVQGIAAGGIAAASFAAGAMDAVWTTALTEAYRATGATGTAAQLLYELLANLTDFAISGTTKTARKLNGTTAKTYTLNDATAPTAITEAT